MNFKRNIKKSKSFNIGDRAVAIKKAIQSADPQEIILNSWKRTRGRTNL